MNHKFLSFLQVYWNNILILIIINVILILPAIFAPIYQMVFTDDILIDKRTEWLFPLIILMIGTAFFSGLMNYLKNRCILNLENKIIISGSIRYFNRLIHAPVSYFQNNNHSKLLSDLTTSEKLSNLITTELISLLFDTISALFYFIMMLSMNMSMTFIVLGLILVNITVPKLYSFLTLKLKTQKKTYDGSEQSETENLMETERYLNITGLQNMEQFKATACETFFFQQLLNHKSALLNAQKEEDYVTSYEPMNTLPEVFFLNALLLISAIKIMDRNQVFSIGTYLALTTYASAFFYPLNHLFSTGSIFENFKAMLSFDENPIKEPEYKKNIFTPVSTQPLKKLSGAIEFKDVCFGYDTNNMVIQHFNLTVTSGQKIAILGPPGAGKSTLFKLIAGLYTPLCGEISMDGIPSGQIDKDVFESSVGIANQEPVFFSDSIRNNITLWDESIPDSDVYSAASDACIHDYITRLNDAYEHRIPESGKNLSTGQQHCIELARAFLNHPAIILLDETIDFLDDQTASQIEETLTKRGCTCMVATHMLRTPNDYDNIFVLDKGHIIQQGTHEELMRDTDGYYASSIEDFG